jgi:hypothetical protein
MGDAAIMGVIASSAGTAAIETGVRAVAGYSYAAYQAYRIYELGARAKLIISTAYNASNFLAGEIQSLSADTGALSWYPLPAAYQHPADTRPLWENHGRECTNQAGRSLSAAHRRKRRQRDDP